MACPLCNSDRSRGSWLGTAIYNGTIEKNYGTGKVIFVNIHGYLSSISNSSEQYFMTLADIPRMLQIEGDTYNKSNTPNIIRPTRFSGAGRSNG